jgi:rhodanese-related sulfurtransferase
MEQVIAAMSSLGTGALALIVGAVALYIGYKFYQRKRLLRELRMTRITVDELNKKLQAGETPMILDLRSRAALEEDPFVIRGAIHLSMDEVEHRRWEIPRDHDIVVYCSCPNEVSAARAALVLRRQGFSQVRPLLGGIDAWRERKFPLDSPTVETI